MSEHLTTTTAYLQIHPKDNVLVALRNMEKGAVIQFNGNEFQLPQPVPAKHKFLIEDLSQDAAIFMYGVLVGRTNHPIALQPATGNLHGINLM